MIIGEKFIVDAKKRIQRANKKFFVAALTEISIPRELLSVPIVPVRCRSPDCCKPPHSLARAFINQCVAILK
jgi:hypothetical protein